MNLFYKFFRSGQGGELERIWAKAKADVQTVYSPLGELGKAVVNAADSSHKEISSALGISLEGTPSQQRIFELPPNSWTPA